MRACPCARKWEPRGTWPTPLCFLPPMRQTSSPGCSCRSTAAHWSTSVTDRGLLGESCMRRFAFAFVLVLLALELMPSSAQAQWREFRSDADGFSVMLPQEPEVSSRRINDTTATQSMALIDNGDVTYLVSVVHME